MDTDHEAAKHDVPEATVKGEAGRAAAEDPSPQIQDVLDDARETLERGSGRAGDGGRPSRGEAEHRSVYKVELVAAGPHEAVPGGVPLTNARLTGIDAETAQWIDKTRSRFAVYAVPAPAGSHVRLDRPARTIEVSAEEYRSLLGLGPGE